MNFAMLLMYWFPLGSSAWACHVHVSLDDRGEVDPGLAFVVAFILFASAIFTLASPNKGASHFGSHAPAYALVGAAGSDRPKVAPKGGLSPWWPSTNRCHSVAGGPQPCGDVHRHGLHASAHDLETAVPRDGTGSPLGDPLRPDAKDRRDGKERRIRAKDS